MAELARESPSATGTGSGAGPLLSGPAGRALSALTLINLLNYLDRFVVAALAESLKGSELALSDAQLGLLMTGFIVVYMVASPVFGVLGDRGSRPRLIAAGVFVWSLATALAGFARGFASLFLARSAVGVGEAAYGTISPGFLSDLFPRSQRGRVLAFFFAAIPVGSALGYVIGGLVDRALALEVLDPRSAADQAVNLAYLGDLPSASRLARKLPRGSMARRVAAALAAGHRGRRQEALAALERACDRAPALTWRVAPLFLLGELLVRAGRDAEGVEALRRFERLYVWRQMWRSWAWPAAQVALGQALLRLGDGAGAAAALDRLLDAWREADPDAPLLAQARMLRAQAASASR